MPVVSQSILLQLDIEVYVRLLGMLFVELKIN